MITFLISLGIIFYLAIGFALSLYVFKEDDCVYALWSTIFWPFYLILDVWERLYDDLYERIHRR